MWCTVKYQKFREHRVNYHTFPLTILFSARYKISCSCEIKEGWNPLFERGVEQREAGTLRINYLDFFII